MLKAFSSFFFFFKKEKKNQVDMRDICFFIHVMAILKNVTSIRYLDGIIRQEHYFFSTNLFFYEIMRYLIRCKHFFILIYNQHLSFQENLSICTVAHRFPINVGIILNEVKKSMMPILMHALQKLNSNLFLHFYHYYF